MKNTIKIQSISDIITNSSSEVFIISYDPREYLKGEDWSVDKITEELIASSYLRDFVYKVMDIPPFMDGMYIDINHPSRLLEADYDEFKGCDDTYQDLYDLFKEYIKENQEEFDKVLDHYIVMISDHDFENFQSNCDYCDSGYCLGRF